MPSRRSFLPIILSLVCGGLGAGAAAAQAQAQAPEPPAGMTVEQAEEQVQKIRDSLEAGNAPPEVWQALMKAQTVLLELAAREEGLDAEALQAAQRRVRAGLLMEWKTRQPKDPAPFLEEMQGAMAPDQRDAAVLDLLPRFPDDPRLLAEALKILARGEQPARASALIDEALDRHPERSALYVVALSFYREQKDEVHRHQVASSWIENHPGDPDALRAWFDNRPPADRDPRVAADRVERFVGAEAPESEEKRRVEACGWLLTADGGAYHDAAVRCLTAMSAEARDPRLRKRAAGLLAGEHGAAAQDGAGHGGR